ncbi:MAG: TonB-dependent receptor [Candidatus Aminicenantes bacterium]|nr:TonB-dependent receptor [Candidatus Aminicenantes bacterium]
MYKKLRIFALLSICIVGLAFSQVGLTGNIRGTVTLSPDETVLPGVSVILKSPALVLKQLETVTNESGAYRLHSLPPGLYEITFEMAGMDTVVRREISVSADVTVTLDVKMRPATLETSIVVEANAPILDQQTTAVNTVLSAEFIRAIPTQRNLDSMMNMAPGVNGNVSMGAGARDNNYNMDGVNTNDPETGTNAAAFNIDIAEEISVLTGGVRAEHVGGAGAVINVITKSGGNAFSGTLTGYYTNDKLLGDNTKKYPDLAKPTGNKFEIEPGFTLGGPILKDKLWFFTSLNYYKNEERIAGFPALSATEILQPQTRLTPYVKLTFASNQKNRFQATFSYDAGKTNYSDAVWWRTAEATSNLEEKTTAVALHWNHTFNSSFYTNFSVAYFKVKLDWVNNGQGTSYWDAANEVQYGSEGQDDLNDRQRFQADVDGTLFKDDFLGSHEIKFGVQFQRAFWIREINVYGQDDGYGQHLGWVDIYPGNWRDRYWWADFLSRVDVQKIGFFFSDAWAPIKRLTLSLGLRYDLDSTIFPKSTDTSQMSAPSGDFGYIGSPGDTWNMIVPETITAYSWKNFSPRLGLIFDVTNDGKTFLKANYARYTAPNYSFYAAYLNPVNWVGYCDGIDPDGNVYALWWTRVPGTNTRAGYKDHKLEAPRSDEFSVGLEREIFDDWSVMLRYTRRWDRKLIETADASQLDLDELMNSGRYIWTNWTPYTFTDPRTGKQLTAWSQNAYRASQNYIINPPDAKRDYKGFEISLKKRFSHGWELLSSYVYNDSRGMMDNYFSVYDSISPFYNDPNAHENAYGHLPAETRHEFKLFGLINGPLGINVSGSFRYLSGNPYTRRVNPRDLGVAAVRSSTWVFAEPRGSSRLNNRFLVDLRLEKRFQMSNSIAISAFCDIFNLLNDDAIDSIQTDDASWTTYNEVFGLEFPRYFRLGARIEF